MKKIVIIIFVIFLSYSILFAIEKITGAFGIKLNNKFELSKTIGKSELTDGTPMYQFSPTKRFRSFKYYYVMITPKTKKIYSIWGVGSMENNEKCKKEQNLIINLLEKKYGKAEKQGFIYTMYDAKYIYQGNRNILVKCSGFTDITIDIRYTDQKLKKIAEKEHLEIEKSKVDDSGL